MNYLVVMAYYASQRAPRPNILSYLVCWIVFLGHGSQHSLEKCHLMGMKDSAKIMKFPWSSILPFYNQSVHN